MLETRRIRRGKQFWSGSVEEQRRDESATSYLTEISRDRTAVRQSLAAAP